MAAAKKIRNGKPASEPKKPASRARTARKPASRKKKVVVEQAGAPPPDGEKVEPRKPGVGLTFVERHRIGVEIMVARHQQPPVTWKNIAATHGITERSAYRIYHDLIQSKARLGDDSGLTVVEEDLNVMEMQIEELAADALKAKTVTERVAAIRQMVALMDRRLRMLALLGRMPRSFRAANELVKLQMLVQNFARLLEKHQIEPEIVQEFLALARGEYEGVDFGAEMRALPAGS